MHKLVKKVQLNPQITLMEVEAPHVVRNARPGQFVIVHIDETAERIPLTIYDTDIKKGTITIIFQIVGTATSRLNLLNVGDLIQDILGPLGHPTQIKDYGKVICIAGGVGVAEVLPVAKALSASPAEGWQGGSAKNSVKLGLGGKEKGNFVLSIIGARNKELLILKDEMQTVSSKLLITTDDGSLGHKGFVTDLLEEELKKDRYEIIFCVGPIPMMKKASEVAKKYNTKIIVSLSSNMVDATGMCGTCRVSVGGKTYFTCVDGPEFDGTLVDFDELMIRDKRFADEERISFEEFKNRHKCVNKVRKRE